MPKNISGAGDVFGARSVLHVLGAATFRHAVYVFRYAFTSSGAVLSTCYIQKSSFPVAIQLSNIYKNALAGFGFANIIFYPSVDC